MATYNFDVREGHIARFTFPAVTLPAGATAFARLKTNTTDTSFLKTYATDITFTTSGITWIISAGDANEALFPAYYELGFTVGGTSTTILYSGYIEFEESPYIADEAHGVVKHSDLSGLDQDDHLQYFNAVRGDAHYYPRDEANVTFVKSVNGQHIDPQTGDVSVVFNGTIDESNIVHKSGTETIGGAKTFLSGIVANGQNVVLANDPKLSDARTPTAHAASHNLNGSDPLNAVNLGASPRDHRWKANTPVYAGQLLTNAGVIYQVTTDFTTPAAFNTTNLTATSSVSAGSLTPAAFDTGTAAALASFSSTVQVINPVLVTTNVYQVSIDMASTISNMWKVTIPDGTNVQLNVYVTNVPAAGANLARIANVDIIQNATGNGNVIFNGVGGNTPALASGGSVRNRFTITATDGIYTAKLDEVVSSPTLDQRLQMLGAELYWDFDSNGAVELDKSGKLRNGTYVGVSGTDYVQNQPSLTTSEPNGRSTSFSVGYLGYGDGFTAINWFDPHDFWTVFFLIQTPSSFTDASWVQTNMANKTLLSAENIQNNGSIAPSLSINVNSAAPYQNLRVVYRDDQNFSYNGVTTTLPVFDGRKIFCAISWDPTNNGANPTGTYNAGTPFTGIMKAWQGSPSNSSIQVAGSATTSVPANSTLNVTGITWGSFRRAGSASTANIPHTADKFLVVKGKDISASLNSFYQAMA